MNKKLELQQYKADEGVSQSQLKAVLINNLIDKIESDSIATYKGSLTDVLCLVPELFDEFYHLTQLEKEPPPQIKQCLDKAYQIQIDIGLQPEWDNGLLLESFRTISNVKTGDDKVLENLLKHENYWEELIQSLGKKVITQDYYNICNSASLTLKSHPNVKHCFENDLFSDILYQVPLYCDYTIDDVTIRLKGLLDMLQIDHRNKTVRIRDLKTTSSSPDEWKYIARKYNYAFQMAYYYNLVNKCYPEYQQLMPELVIYSFAAPNKPFIKVLSLDDLFGGRYGFERIVATNIYERVEESVAHESIFVHGWETALQRYIQAKQLGLPDYDIDYHVTKGVSKLNLWT